MTSTVTIDDRELIVTYEAYPPSRGKRDRYGVPLEPDEDAAIEIESVTDEGGAEVDTDLDEIERQIWDELNDFKGIDNERRIQD